MKSRAGQNITAAIDALRVELNGRIDAQKEIFGAEIRAARWMLGAIPALLAVLAVLGLCDTALGLIRQAARLYSRGRAGSAVRLRASLLNYGGYCRGPENEYSRCRSL